MSLINQMLQELDARRSDASGSSSFGQQVRVVYERNRTRPLLWSALAAAGVLVGAGAWFWLRPPAPAPIAPAAQVTPAAPTDPAAVAAQPASAATMPSLPLKFDTDLNIAQRDVANVPQGNPEPAQTVAAAPVQNKPADSAGAAAVPEKKAVPPVTADAKAPDTASGTKNGAAKPRASEKPSHSAPSDFPEVAKVVPQTKALLAAPSGKTNDRTEAPVINKQFKELTPQQRAENEYRKGVASLQQGKGSEAVASLEQALELDPMHAAARQTLIGVLLEKQHKDGAVRRAKEGLAIDAAQPGLAMILARLQLEKGELQPAIETLERTLPYAVDRADYQAFLAALLQRAERHKEAVEHYFAALQKTPQNGVWWMGVGISLQADRRKPEAAEAFKRAKATGTLSAELVQFVDAQLAQLQQR